MWMRAGSSLEVRPWHGVRCGGDVETSDGAELRLDAAPGRLVHLARPLPHDFYWQGALVMLPQHLGGRQAGGRRAGKAAMPIGRREADRSSVSAEQKAACLCAGQRSPSPPPLRTLRVTSRLVTSRGPPAGMIMPVRFRSRML